MRFRLRTLMIAMAVGPPLIAIIALSFIMDRFPGLLLTLAVLTILVILRAIQAGRSLIFWPVLLWICGYGAAFVVGYQLMNHLVFNRIESLDDGGYGWPVMKAVTLGVALAAGSLIVFAAGRPIPTTNR